MEEVRIKELETRMARNEDKMNLVQEKILDNREQIQLLRTDVGKLDTAVERLSKQLDDSVERLTKEQTIFIERINSFMISLPRTLQETVSSTVEIIDSKLEDKFIACRAIQTEINQSKFLSLPPGAIGSLLRVVIYLLAMFGVGSGVSSLM